MCPTIRVLKIRWVVLGLAATLILAASPLAASPPIAEQESLTCTVCHDKPGSRLMTDRGKYYEARGTLEGYDDLVALFGQCTTCHDTRPGATDLTETGECFLRVVNDMEGLETWMKVAHPVGPLDQETARELIEGAEEVAGEPDGKDQ